MLTFDLIIRKGTVIDGTGDERFSGNVAIKDGLIRGPQRVELAEAAE